MKDSRNFDNILDECLERMLRKGQTVEQCLADYPEHAAELAPLLRTAMTAKTVSALKPRPEFKARARYEFQSAVRQAQEKPRRHFLFNWQPRWAAVPIALLILVIGSGGTLAAASNAMPDSALYPVKLTAEAVRVTLTPSDLDKARLYTQLADKRVDEIIKMAEKSKPDQVDKATEKLEAYLQKAATLTGASERTAGVFMAPVATPDSEARALAPAAPAPVPAPTLAPRPTPAPAAPTTAAPTPATPAPVITIPPPAKAPSAADTSTEKTAKKDATDSDKAKVKAAVVKSAASHVEALKAALKQAPDSVKPALKRAIAVSDAKYRQLLESLDK